MSAWYGDSSSPLRVLYLVDKNKAFFLDTDNGVGFGFVEPQSAVPAGGFSNASLSGTFPAATAAPSISPNLNGCGLATLDGSGSFTEAMRVSTVSGLFLDQTTSGTYSVAANGRGTVTNINITTPSISISIVGISIAVAFLLASRKRRRDTFRPAFAMFCLTVLIATTPAACPQPGRPVFYVISPTKAVMIHEAIFDRTPVITIIEQ